MINDQDAKCPRLHLLRPSFEFAIQLSIGQTANVRFNGVVYRVEQGGGHARNFLEHRA
jgi:hypothetical protein